MTDSALLDAFARTFGGTPDGVWSAPGRANLIGDHTDYNGGLALPFAIDRRARLALAGREDRTVRVASTGMTLVGEATIDDLTGEQPPRLDGWIAYPLGLIWALGRHLGGLPDVRGVDVVFDSNVPVGAGVSSSHALACALAVALVDHWRLPLTIDDLIVCAQRAENVVAGAPTGTLDQSAILRARSGHGVLLDFDAGTAALVPLPLQDDGLAVLLIDSHVAHAHSDAGYGTRRAECEEAAHALGVTLLSRATLDDLERARPTMRPEVYRRARHVLSEDDRVREVAALVRAGDTAGIGPILTSSHVSMRDDFENSVPAIDTAVTAAIAAGALGARLTGGGFGGACLALVRADEIDQISDHVRERVVAEGFTLPTITPVLPSDGAGRDAEDA